MRNPVDKPAGDLLVDPESMATYIKAAHEESDDGELVIAIPPVIQEAVQAGDPNDKSGMTIRILYELANPVAGLHFVLPHESSYPNRPAHMYSNNVSGARCWMPCLDTLLDRCRWVIELEVASDLTVAASGVATAQPQEVLSKDNSNAHASLHASEIGSASGPTASHTKDSKLKRYTFVVTEPVPASSIGFAVGKFEAVADDTLPGKLTFYNLPGRNSLLANTVGFVSQSLEYLEAILHSPLPAKHLKLVFVDDTPTKVSATAGLILCSTHLLHSQDIIDQTYATRRAISVGLAMQWFPTLVASATVQDSWVIDGIVGYLAYLNYKKIFGQSEFRSAVLEDLNYVIQGTRLATKRKRPHAFSKRMDDQDDDTIESHASFITNTLFTQSLKTYCTHSRYPNDPEPVDFLATERLGDAPYLNDVLISDFDSPLYFSNFITAQDTSTRYFETRSTLAMLQLEKMVGGEIMRQLLELLVRPDENTGKPPDQLLTAKQFFKICKKSVSDKDFSQFASDWIYEHGFPHLYVGFQYHPDTREVEFGIKQDTKMCHALNNSITVRMHAGRPNTSASLVSSSSSALSAMSTSTIPNSDATNEEEGESNVEDFPIMLEGPYQRYFTKAKTANNSAEKPAKKKRRASAKKAAKMDMDDTEDEDDMDDLAGPEGAEARQARAQNDLGWIRVDPDFEWLRYLSFSQPEYMWITQLEHDRDVLAQYEGIDGLVRSASSERACIALDRVLRNKQNFFKVRMRAASALGVLATKFPSGFVLLRRFFLDNYCDRPESADPSARSSATTTATVSAASTPAPHNPNAMAVDTRPSTPANSIGTAGGEPEEDEYAVRPNDFDDFEAYFLQKAVVHAIATIRDLKNLTPPEVLAFLTDLLDSNDNSRNAYSDNYYVASLISALTYVRSESPLDYKNMVRQMERYLGKEKNMPCFHNVIAQACLHFLATLQANGHLELEMNAFKPYISYGNFPSVRAVAMRCYLRVAICVAQTEASIDDIFDTINKVMRNDPSMWFKEKTAFALATALESGADLDFLLNSPRANTWRKILYQLINSEATSYSPRVRCLLLASLRSIDGGRIAQVPKLPPRKLYPTHPMKAGMVEKKKQSAQNGKRSSTPSSYDSTPSHAVSHATMEHSSERPQRKAAIRARMVDDPFEELLGNGSFVTPAAASVPAAASPASAENKPKKLIIAKLRVAPAPTATAPTTAPPTTVPAPATSTALPAALPPAITLPTQRPLTEVEVKPEASRPALQATTPLTTASSEPAPAAAPKRAVFKFKPSQTTTAPIATAADPVPAISAPTEPVQVHEPVQVQETPKVVPAPTPDATAAPTPKPVGAKFVFKRSAPAPAPSNSDPETTMDAPAAKKPKLEEAS